MYHYNAVLSVYLWNVQFGGGFPENQRKYRDARVSRRVVYMDATDGINAGGPSKLLN